MESDCWHRKDKTMSEIKDCPLDELLKNGCRLLSLGDCVATDDAVDGCPNRMPKTNTLAVEDVLDEMSRIISEHPAAMEYETDARDTWPERWGALLGYLKAKRDIANKG